MPDRRRLAKALAIHEMNSPGFAVLTFTVWSGRAIGDSSGISGAIALDPEESGAIPIPISGAIEADRRRSPDTRDLEEEKLIARCLNGEVEAFRPLVQRYQRLAFSVAFRMLGSRADAEDIAQQAFVDAFNALDRFRGDGPAARFFDLAAPHRGEPIERRAQVETADRRAAGAGRARW